MATREDVYEQFGRAAHAAQLLETDIGTALLALDAITTKSYLQPDADAYLRLRQAIDKQTLGISIKQIAERLHFADDLATRFDNALDTRNRLIHRFFAQHGLAWFDASGRDNMVHDLRKIEAELRQAHAIAQDIAGKLVNHVRERTPQGE